MTTRPNTAPYRGKAGEYYVHGSALLDYRDLGRWCEALPGQRIVCEGAGADWLDFVPFGNFKTLRGSGLEMVWSDR